MKTLPESAMMRLFTILVLTIHMAPVVRGGNMGNCLNCKKIYMDEYLKSIDDEFNGCTDQMYQLVKSKHLELELSNQNFKTVWQKAKTDLYLNGKITSQLTNEDLRRIALRVYTDVNFYTELNGKMRNGICDYKTIKFGLISLHFLITHAIQLLKPKDTCPTTFRFAKESYEIKGDLMRFGSFTSSSRISTLKGFGKETCFVITTCYGADISAFSAFKSEAEVLIPPYERFRKTKLPQMFREKHPELKKCKTIHRLESAGKLSVMKCDFVNSKIQHSVCN
ncbi:erythroblast NAD(P)(+)--arginine ADP-ribosyltransferase-like [Salminus brasiliensis]|uniref:erythroblast NAD(P)(+)--arginine ADP-ribosyltransferase-like n=1 Tax=Salminus brasiliensis TaxID=930266 RepID=UPI003B833581